MTRRCLKVATEAIEGQRLVLGYKGQTGRKAERKRLKKHTAGVCIKVYVTDITGIV